MKTFNLCYNTADGLWVGKILDQNRECDSQMGSAQRISDWLKQKHSDVKHVQLQNGSVQLAEPLDVFELARSTLE